MTVFLPIRPTKKTWLKLLEASGMLVLVVFLIIQLLGRIITENTPDPSRHLYWAVAHSVAGGAALLLVGAVGLLHLAGRRGRVQLTEPVMAANVALAEDMLTVGLQVIQVAELKSIVLTSDKHAGALVGRYRSSGNGRLTVTYKAQEQRVSFLVVESARQLAQLRELAGNWRRQQITAFIMD